MTAQQHDFLQRAARAAKQAAHIFPEMAACEAALESGYGRSLLAIQDRNLFGMKQHEHPIYGTHALPTREFLDSQWTTVTVNWVSYPDWQSCFADRMASLQRLASVYPHYKNALAAASPTTYVIEVSRSWSTDPGWMCDCGDIFLSNAEALTHLHSNPSHHVSQVPGAGRGEKVLMIYEACAGDWDAMGS